jgi:hypothetical protein
MPTTCWFTLQGLVIGAVAKWSSDEHGVLNGPTSQNGAETRKQRGLSAAGRHNGMKESFPDASIRSEASAKSSYCYPH